MEKQFPRTNVGGVELSRMIIGTNPLLGWSHISDSYNAAIKDHYNSPERFIPVLETYMKYGIDAIMAPFPICSDLHKAVKMTEDKLGRGMVMVDTAFLNLEDTPEGRAEARQAIRESAERGTKIFMIHNFCARGLVNFKDFKLDRISDYTDMIREAGMVPALGSHAPELVEMVDQHGYDFESYLQLYNCHGFMMHYEVEKCAKTIHNAKKPVMTIKSMAAGRLTPYVGLTWAWKTLREQDMVTVGAFNVPEADEDIEISFAALENRFPNLPFNL